jgi:hypothetical protein
MKTLSIIKYIFTIIGLGMLLGSLYWYQSIQSFTEEALRTEGTVVELVSSRSDDSYVYKPVVRFTTDQGELMEFISGTGSNPPGFTVGETVGIFYLASDPQEAMIDDFFSLWGGPLIVAGMGIIFFVIGGSIFLVSLLQKQKEQYLKTNGLPVQTKFQSVEINTHLSVRGRNPYRVLTQWKNPETSEIHVFKSNNLWFDPTDYITREYITVLIERSNPKKYYVDLSFLPKIAI